MRQKTKRVFKMLVMEYTQQTTKDDNTGIDGYGVRSRCTIISWGARTLNTALLEAALWENFVLVTRWTQSLPTRTVCQEASSPRTGVSNETSEWSDAVTNDAAASSTLDFNLCDVVTATSTTTCRSPYHLTWVRGRREARTTFCNRDCVADDSSSKLS